jgi:hypothetical protein
MEELNSLNGKVIDYISGCNVDSESFVIKFEDDTSIDFSLPRLL